MYNMSVMWFMKSFSHFPFDFLLLLFVKKKNFFDENVNNKHYMISPRSPTLHSIPMLLPLSFGTPCDPYARLGTELETQQ